MDEALILALIPAWNEAERIGPVVKAAQEYLPVLVVDDGSADDTSDVAVAAGAIVVRHPRNRGKGAALKMGFAVAEELGFSHVLTIDADGQHDPQDIQRLLDKINAGQVDTIPS